MLPAAVIYALMRDDERQVHHRARAATRARDTRARRRDEPARTPRRGWGVAPWL